MALPLTGQVEPDRCTASCHDGAMVVWNSVFDSAVADGFDPADAETAATIVAGGVFWRCVALDC